MKNFIILLSFIILPLNTFAQPSFDNITESDFEGISKEFSANFAHRPISPASSMGQIFGFEVGLVAGITEASKVEEISKREAPTEDPLDKLAHVGILAAVSVPFGLTPELVVFPEQEFGDLTFGHYSLGLKWTFSQFLSLPLIDLAARVHTSKTDVSFTDNVDGVNTTVNLENTTSGITLLASASLLVIEPFIGFGYVSRNTDLGATGTARIFNTTFTTSATSSSDGSSTQLIAGVQANLLLLRVAAQYENLFGTSVTSAKITLGF